MIKRYCVAAILGACLSSAAFANDPIEINGVGLTRDIDCASNDVTISGVENTINLTGECKAVVVHGARQNVTFEMAGEFLITGADNKIRGGSAQSLETHVTNNDVEISLRPTQDGVASLSVAGSKNSISVKLEGPTTINVVGANNSVSWSAQPGVKPPKVDIAGVKNAVNKAK